MALIKCPKCGKEISDQSKRCIHCGYPLIDDDEQQLKNNIQSEPCIKKKSIKLPIVIAGCVILICLLGILISKITVYHNPYYIDLKKNAKIKDDSFAEILSEETVNDIDQFITLVVDWYNQIDISEPLSIDFVDDEINDLGRALFNDVRVQEYVDSAGTLNEDIFKMIYPARSIYGDIAGIMVNSELTYYLSSEAESTITITEDSWIDLGNTIKDAIDFYYE